jgi:hypothetical protein
MACGEADRALVESPDYLFSFRYDAYRRDHDVFYDAATAAWLKGCSSASQAVTLTFTGGEILRLRKDRILEILHLPGHSHGHLGCSTGGIALFTTVTPFKARVIKRWPVAARCALLTSTSNPTFKRFVPLRIQALKPS